MNTAGLGARLVANPRRDRAYAGTPRGKTQPISFHRTMPGYAATPVVEMPELAAICRIARIVVKNEQERLGLPSFKLLGSSWALHQRVKAVADLSSDALIAFPDLCRIVPRLGPPTLFEEPPERVARRPDLLFVQAGVGVLSAAAVSSLRRISATTRVVVVEPEGSNAIALSFASGAPVSVPDAPTVMACLRCQSPSFVAWPILLAGVDGAIVVSDDEAAVAVRELARKEVVAGASGAASLAGALVACADEPLRARLGVTPDSQVAVVNTEGATDPASYAAILAR